VPLAHLRAYGGRFDALMERWRAARLKPSAKARHGIVQLIGARTREPQPALPAHPASHSGRAQRSRLEPACWTALRTVEMTFEWDE